MARLTATREVTGIGPVTVVLDSDEASPLPDDYLISVCQGSDPDAAVVTGTSLFRKGRSDAALLEVAFTTAVGELRRR